MWKVLFIGLLFAGCSDSEFAGSGGTQKAEAPKKQQADAQGEERDEPALGTETPETEDKMNAATETAGTSPLPEPPADRPADLPPTLADDGTEVINDCGRCTERARALAQPLGFAVDMARSVNFGFYKVDPALNVCDIHFFRDANGFPVPHEGKDGVAPDQVFLYCPCDCGWKEPPRIGGGGGSGGTISTGRGW